MLNIQAALISARVPGYRGAFRPRAGCREPPPLYCVYTCVRTPIWASDDRTCALRVQAFLHLYCRGDPERAQAAVSAAMAAQGYQLVRETEGYVEAAEDYEILSEWEGVTYG